MQYNFDIPVNRRDTNSLKWNVKENELPMWVADMDFQTAPEIQKAIQKRVEHGVFGYSIIPDKWYQAIIDWWKRKHTFSIEKEWLTFCAGVVPAVSSIIRKLTTVGENILVQTPVYSIFFNSIINNGRIALENPLIYQEERYEIDFEDLEKKLSNPQTSMMILCNPHNPIGKIWTKKELEKIGELCWKYHVVVISDEIHCDIIKPGNHYIPFASVSEKCKQNSITCIAPTKAFNLAGLQTAAIIVPNENLRNKVNRGINTDEIAEPNSFAIEATIAAFTQGEEWLNELCKYLQKNKQYIEEFLKKEIPTIKLVPSEATYLVWIDCSKVLGDAAELAQFIRKHTGLFVSAGEQYRGNGTYFLRMNIACPYRILQDGLQRMKNGILEYEKWVITQC